MNQTKYPRTRFFTPFTRNPKKLVNHYDSSVRSIYLNWKKKNSFCTDRKTDSNEAKKLIRIDLPKPKFNSETVQTYDRKNTPLKHFPTEASSKRSARSEPKSKRTNSYNLNPYKEPLIKIPKPKRNYSITSSRLIQYRSLKIDKPLHKA